MSYLLTSLLADQPIDRPAVSCFTQCCSHGHCQIRGARAKTSAAAIAASIAAEGYDSDEEVYATAKALEGEGEEGQDADIAAKVGVRLSITGRVGDLKGGGCLAGPGCHALHRHNGVPQPPRLAS
jgi:hypothetical protein